ncbi:MAG: DUF1127 domain-containing protein [Pseudomonadota bacterium]
MSITISNKCVSNPHQLNAKAGLWGTLTSVMALRQQRKALKDLDEHLLRDIGVTRQDAEIEAEKPIWDVPRHWFR